MMYYTATFRDADCGHVHKSFATAEACALRYIRAAHKGDTFGFPVDASVLLGYTEAEAEQCVKRHTGSR